MKSYFFKIAFLTILSTSKSAAQVPGSNGLWGANNHATGQVSGTGGLDSIAGGFCSIAFGHTCWATNAHSIALGLYAKAYGGGSFSQGWNSLAEGEWSMAFGISSNAKGYGAFAQGVGSKAYGDWSLAMGDSATAWDWQSRAFGYQSNAGDPDPNINFSHCYAFGFQSAAKNHNAMAFAPNSKAFGENSITLGAISEASGKSAVTLGESSTASGDQTTAIGEGSKALALHSVAAGPFPVARGNPTLWVNTDPVFTIANGQSDTARSNALVVLKSGAVLVKPAGDLSMGSFTAGIKPDDTTP